MSYSSGARSLVQGNLRARAAIAEASPNFGEIVTQFSKNRTYKEKAAMKAQANVLGDLATSNAKLKGMQIKADAAQSVKNTNRMAGMLAAGVGMIGLAVPDKADPYEGLYDKFKADQDKLLGEREQRLRTKLEGADTYMPEGLVAPTKPADYIFPSDLEGQPGMSAPGASLNQQSSSTLGGAFSGSPKGGISKEEAAALYGLREGESLSSGGYNAYNLGGRTEFEPVGSGDSSVDKRFGKPLTQMTINEIDALGQSGKIHATGGYQFTHNTGSFREAVKFAGLKGNELFTPEVQDRMALAFGRRPGYGVDRWSAMKKPGFAAQRQALINIGF